ncbi:type IV pilus modification PilV family protein [Vibrio rotiferianus]|jgi:type IV pilus assembly protein PilV|uniref:type IV pilus modification PilV family protein n=1 Tax=Vibrio rotiferianus TaxID=190895 RepID=UPI000B59E49D|nr:type IV pilin [Vibrio rotiferianus]ASI97214.1 type IV pilin [Vibrio rotiferianus]NOH68725.1 type IV pilin [Vibrio rotiferianus]TMX57583.1 type IV pilin [Vibrio rotiferianus]CAH1551131.1 Type IV fimbrial biogenesis protein PilV [Vibrio rotiferianus]
MIFNQRGVGMLEVLFSVMLIAGGVLSLIKLQVYMEKESEYALNSLEALQLAEEKLEWFRTRGASSASSDIVVADFDADIIAGNSTNGAYTVQWELLPAPIANLKVVKVEATWLDRAGDTQGVELQTMISRYSEFD